MASRIISARNSPIIFVARQRGVAIFEPESPNLLGFVEAMSDLSPDLFMAVGYTKLLKKRILSTPRIAAVNFHASPLPAYRGKHPVFWVLRGGECRSGLTVHVMDSGCGRYSLPDAGEDSQERPGGHDL